MKFIHEAIPSSSSADIQTWDPEFGKKVVRMTITKHCPTELSIAMRKGLEQVQNITNLDWDFVDKGEISLLQIPPPSFY